MIVSKAKVIVEELLVKYPKLRDNDNRLIANYWAKELEELKKPVKSLSGEELITLISKGGLSAAESITRCRRKLQENNPNLRGRNYNEKKTTSVEETISDLAKEFGI